MGIALKRGSGANGSNGGGILGNGLLARNATRSSLFSEEPVPLNFEDILTAIEKAKKFEAQEDAHTYHQQHKQHLRLSTRRPFSCQSTAHSHGVWPNAEDGGGHLGEELLLEVHKELSQIRKGQEVEAKRRCVSPLLCAHAMSGHGRP